MYRFMSFNLRTQTEVDKEQQFIYRVGFLCDTILEWLPDVIGLQEMQPLMRSLMIDRLPGYVFLGGGREKDRLGESVGIAVRQSRFMIERVTSDMLSFTPEIPGSTYGLDQSGCPRVLTACDLMPVEGGSPFRFMNIHTDHVGETARMLEVQQMLSLYYAQQALRPMPTIITGDFNATPETPEMQLLIKDPAFIDLSADLPGTFHDYDRREDPEKIDYIFATREWKADKVFLIHEKRNHLFLSDHDPVVAEVTLS